MNRGPIRLIVAAAVVCSAAACVDRPRLFDPEDPPTINMTLPAGEIAVHEHDTVRVAVLGEDVKLTAQLLLLDSLGSVLWRSQPVAVADGEAVVPVDNVPAAVERGARVFVTGVLADAAGARYYASDDSVAAQRLADAARREARVWAGRHVRTAGGEVPGDLSLDPDRGRAYFPVPNSSSVGILDLAAGGLVVGGYDVGFRPGRVAYRAGVLAVLGASGGEFMFVRTTDGAAPGVGTLLPPLELELDTTFLGAVRPTGRGLAIGCVDEGCTQAFALVPSGLQVMEGTVADPAAASVLRVLTPGDGPAEARAPAIALPAYTSVLRGDTSLTATLFAARAPDGNRAEVFTRAGVSGCLATALGGALLTAWRNGVAYVATPSAGTPACGPGTSIVRLDGVGTRDVTVSALAVRNTVADERIRNPAFLQVAETGTALLALAENAVLVLDPYLRVKGSVPAPGARAVEWMRGGSAENPRFAVADATGITVYDAERLTVVHRVRVGPTDGPLVFLQRATGERVVAAPTTGGFVVASVPGEEDGK